MSLIEQALRQAQTAISRPPAQSSIGVTEPLTTPATGGDPAIVVPSHWQNLLPAVGVGLVVMGLSAWVMLTFRVGLSIMPASRTQVVIRPASSPASPPALATLAAEPKPVAQPRMPVQILELAQPESQAPPFSLNGIVEGVGEPFAIINGTIVRLGESIEGATLTEVAQGKATLRWNDQNVVLRTSR